VKVVKLHIVNVIYTSSYYTAHQWTYVDLQRIGWTTDNCEDGIARTV